MATHDLFRAKESGTHRLRYVLTIKSGAWTHLEMISYSDPTRLHKNAEASGVAKKAHAASLSRVSGQPV
jgi:hypothetical protein